VLIAIFESFILINSPPLMRRPASIQDGRKKAALCERLLFL